MLNYEKIWLNKQIVNRFDVIKPISNGGMGVLFLAYDNNLQKNVILKTPLIKDSSLKAEIDRRFFREVYCLTTLEHPFIVPIIYSGMHDDHPFIVSRYINGGDLRDLINHSIVAHQSLTFESVATWVPKIGAALTFMHANDWIHCDIKPDNILFDRNHHCYLTDFGISNHLSIAPTNNCLTSCNTILGSPMYMAPEQHLGHKPTPKCDQFSLAVVIYQALTNKLPFNGKTPSAILLEIIRQIPIPLKSHPSDASITTSASNAIMKALNFDPDLRHESIEHFLNALFKDSDGKLELDEFHKTTHKILASTQGHFHDTQTPIKKPQHYTDTISSTKNFLTMENKIQTMCDRILDKQIHLTPEQLTKFLNYLIESEILDKNKPYEILDSLDFIFLLESVKTKTNAAVFQNNATRIK